MGIRKILLAIVSIVILAGCGRQNARPETVNDGIGLPEEVQGAWISAENPPWSLDIRKSDIDLIYDEEIVATLPVNNYENFPNDESRAALNSAFLVSVSFDWPENREEKATAYDIRIQRTMIKLLIESDESGQILLTFIPSDRIE